MKSINVLYALFLLALLAACKEKSSEHEGHDATASDQVQVSENQVLYNEVMKIHDEVMPKMNDIYSVKQELRKTLSKPELTEVEKMKIEAMISRLDSASESMMVWMREFQPVPDSDGEEKAREYLETEMEKVKKVRENILQALAEAKQ
jgi:hypothetical protein